MIVNAILLVFATTTGSLPSFGNMPEGHPFLIKMFSLAKVHNSTALKHLEDSVTKADDLSISLGYSVALYLSNGKLYSKQFIERFPIDQDGVSTLYNLGISDSLLFPNFLYPFEELGKLAESGNDSAVRILFQVLMLSDGVITGALCEPVSKLFSTKFEKSISHLMRFEPDERGKAYTCLEELNPNEIKKLKTKAKSLAGKSHGERKNVLSEILEWESVAQE